MSNTPWALRQVSRVKPLIVCFNPEPLNLFPFCSFSWLLEMIGRINSLDLTDFEQTMRIRSFLSNSFITRRNVEGGRESHFLGCFCFCLYAPAHWCSMTLNFFWVFWIKILSLSALQLFSISLAGDVLLLKYFLAPLLQLTKVRTYKAQYLMT